MERNAYESLDDEALVRTVQRNPDADAGRRAASALLMRWRERLYAWCWRMTRDRELAADLAQECLVRAHRGLARFEFRCSVSTWMFTIARNRCRSALRARPLRREDGIEPDTLDDWAAGPEDSADARLRLERVLAAMDEALSPIERRALWLRAHEGLHVEEITRLLRLEGASGARSLLQTARKKLGAALHSSFEEVE
ncbi:MAG: sigma-70 family RNA polymerase sigma factor [Candidatus Eisenbacteria bacterium]